MYDSTEIWDGSPVEMRLAQVILLPTALRDLLLKAWVRGLRLLVVRLGLRIVSNQQFE